MELYEHLEFVYYRCHCILNYVKNYKCDHPNRPPILAFTQIRWLPNSIFLKKKRESGGCGL